MRPSLLGGRVIKDILGSGIEIADALARKETEAPFICPRLFLWNYQ